MLRLIVLSVLFLFSSVICSTCTSTFKLLLNEDGSTHKKREFHIFYEEDLEFLAIQIECQVSKTVKNVTKMIVPSSFLKDNCNETKYSDLVEDPLKRSVYTVTITSVDTYPAHQNCSARNQLNLIKGVNKNWAVHITGTLSNILVPLNIEDKSLNIKSIDFALNALFIASSYSAGDSTFKSLTDGDFSKVLVTTSFYLYNSLVALAIIALVFIFVLWMLRKFRIKSKREQERVQLIRNKANNLGGSDDTVVEYHGPE